MHQIKFLTGDNCYIKGKTNGIIRYIGKIDENQDIVYGVELFKPLGNSNGAINEKIYFTCKQNYGIFVRGDNIYPFSKNLASRLPIYKNYKNGTEDGTYSKINSSNWTNVINESKRYSNNIEHIKRFEKNYLVKTIKEKIEQYRKNTEFILLDLDHKKSALAECHDEIQRLSNQNKLFEDIILENCNKLSTMEKYQEKQYISYSDDCLSDLSDDTCLPSSKMTSQNCESYMYETIQLLKLDKEIAREHLKTLRSDLTELLLENSSLKNRILLLSENENIKYKPQSLELSESWSTIKTLREALLKVADLYVQLYNEHIRLKLLYKCSNEERNDIKVLNNELKHQQKILSSTVKELSLKLNSSNEKLHDIEELKEKNNLLEKSLNSMMIEISDLTEICALNDELERAHASNEDFLQTEILNLRKKQSDLQNSLKGVKEVNKNYATVINHYKQCFESHLKDMDTDIFEVADKIDTSIGEIPSQTYHSLSLFTIIGTMKQYQNDIQCHLKQFIINQQSQHIKLLNNYVSDSFSMELRHGFDFLFLLERITYKSNYLAHFISEKLGIDHIIINFQLLRLDGINKCLFMLEMAKNLMNYSILCKCYLKYLLVSKDIKLLFKTQSQFSTLLSHEDTVDSFVSLFVKDSLDQTIGIASIDRLTTHLQKLIHLHIEDLQIDSHEEFILYYNAFKYIRQAISVNEKACELITTKIQSDSLKDLYSCYQSMNGTFMSIFSKFKMCLNVGISKNIRLNIPNMILNQYKSSYINISHYYTEYTLLFSKLLSLLDIDDSPSSLISSYEDIISNKYGGIQYFHSLQDKSLKACDEFKTISEYLSVGELDSEDQTISKASSINASILECNLTDAIMDYYKKSKTNAILQFEELTETIDQKNKEINQLKSSIDKYKIDFENLNSYISLLKRNLEKHTLQSHDKDSHNSLYSFNKTHTNHNATI